MGLNMVFRLLDKGYEVHAWNRSPEPRSEAAKAGAKVYETIPELIAALSSPKVIWSMVEAGEPVDEVIAKCLEGKIEKERLTKKDIFVDGVNSHYQDTLRRSRLLAEKGVMLLDCGVSGGIEAARNGACIMAGGPKEAYEQLESTIKDMSAENGYGYFGESGAGHFVKMVHNAIEYGMMQSLGEGINLIKASAYKNVDLAKLTEVWSHASIIAGNLVEFLHKALTKDASLDSYPAEIGSLGTGKWTVEEALALNVPMPAITDAVFNRFSSRGNDAIARKVISALREEFGGHTSHERDHK